VQNCVACGAWRRSTDFGAAEALDGRCRRCRWDERFPAARVLGDDEARRRALVARGMAVWQWRARPYVEAAVERAGSALELAARAGVGEKTIRRALERSRVGEDAQIILIGTLDRVAIADGLWLDAVFPLPEAA
jgi:hypothetical protein